jgi:membrane protease YdiL (CAAX protease family)
MTIRSSDSRSPWFFFVLIVLLSIPLWWIGDSPLPVPVNLPLSALTAFVPALAAAILCYGQSGFQGVRELLRRALDFNRIQNKLWVLTALLLPPLIYGAAYLVMQWAGRPLPDPHIPLWIVPLFFLAYLISGAGEELGWMGYAAEPLQVRWGALRAALILGIVWAVWHSVAFVQTHNPIGWIVWQCVRTVALRVLIVWIYNNNAKSLFAAILLHASDNVCWSLFPNFGSHYDPFVTGMITWPVVAVVILVWGPKTLARYRFARAYAAAPRG